MQKLCHHERGQHACGETVTFHDCDWSVAPVFRLSLIYQWIKIDNLTIQIKSSVIKFVNIELSQNKNRVHKILVERSVTF